MTQLPSLVTSLPPLVTSDAVRWRLARALAPAGVRLEVDWPLGQDPGFDADGAWWTYHLPRPAAWRLEYRLWLDGAADGPVPDPTNPFRVPNAFGERSVIRFPDYRPPGWLATSPAGAAVPIETGPGRLGAAVPVHLWSPPGLREDQPAPLLVAHDGTGMARESSLLAWATAYAARRPLRVALLDTADGCRNGWYAANPAYADHLAAVVLPALHDRVATSAVVGLGASLGALAWLTLHRRHPEAVDALLLQSGSFFTLHLDGQEAGYEHFGRICTAVAAVSAYPPRRVIPIALTCGAIEENLANNRRLVGELRRHGYPVTFAVVPDAHTMIGWRDAWQPTLDQLLDGVPAGFGHGD